VIDAKFGGNSSRWINHSCNPNCYADERDGRIFITALRNIQAGEELNYDYGLIIEERYTKKLKAEYPCWCGSRTAGHAAGPQAWLGTARAAAAFKAKGPGQNKGKNEGQRRCSQKSQGSQRGEENQGARPACGPPTRRNRPQ
jgi:Proteins containing SET domain